VEALDAGADVVYHDLYLVTHAGQQRSWRRVRARDLAAPVYEDLIQNGNALPNSSVVIRRSILQAAGGMPEDRDVIAMEDFLCWLNATKLTDRFRRIPGSFGYYWAGGGNITGDERTVALLDVFESRYCRSSNGSGPPSWVAYGRGRALYRLGRYDAAQRQLRLVRKGSLVTRAKSWWMRLAMVVS
jgi:hypothetical protein